MYSLIFTCALYFIFSSGFDYCEHWQNVESSLKLQSDSLTSAIDYIKTYMTSYVAGNELNADFYAYVFILVSAT